MSKNHHKTTSLNDKNVNVENIATEPDLFSSHDISSSSKYLVTEGCEDSNDKMFSSLQKRKKSTAKSHMHLPKAQKVSFELQSPPKESGNHQKNQKTWFGVGQKGFENSGTSPNSYSNESNQTSEFHISLTSSISSPNGQKFFTKDETIENEPEDDSLKKSKDTEGSIEEHREKPKSCFRGLMKFQTALSSSNPYFLSSMGFSALSMQDSSSMFRSARNLKTTMKLTKSLNENPQVLYHLPIEKPLLTKEDMDFIEKIMKKQNEETIKITNLHNKQEKIKRKTLEVELEGQEWEVSEYNTKEFNLDNVYKNFLVEQKPKLLLSVQNSGDLRSSTELPSVLEKEVEESAKLRKKTNNSLKVPLTSKNSPNKAKINFPTNPDSITEFLSTSFYESNQNYVHEDEMLRINEIVKNCKKFKEIRETNVGLKTENETEPKIWKNPDKISNIIENIRLNAFLKCEQDNDNDEILSIGKISFNLKQSGLFILGNQPLVLNFSGHRLVQIIINHNSHSKEIEEIWQDNNLIISQEDLVLGENTITFLAGSKYDFFNTPLQISNLSLIHPFFDCLEKNIDLHMTILYNQNLKLISSFPHIFVQKLSEFELDPSLSLKDFTLTKMSCSHAKPNQALIIGDFEEILVNDAFNFYCPTGYKKLFIKKSMGISDVLRLAEVFYSNYFKLLSPLKINLRLIFTHQRVMIKMFEGLNLIKFSYMMKEDKLPTLLFMMLKLILQEIFILNEINFKPEYSWVFHGLSGFLILHFLEKPLSSSFEVPINEIKLLMLEGKTESLQYNLLSSGSHPLNDSSLDSHQKDDSINIFKSLYLFHQLAAYIGKKAIHEVLMELDYKHFTVKLFLEKLNPFLREKELFYFKKWLGVWICGSQLQEIEFEIYANPQRPLLLNELVILQRCLNKGEGSNEINYHFVALTMINNAGISQFNLEIVIPNNGESCIVDKIKGKYVPKALIIDPDNCDYFIQKYDIKTKTFLCKFLHKIHDPKIRASCYLNFYLEVLLGRFNVLDLFQMMYIGLELEQEFSILKMLCKYCKIIYKTLSHEEQRQKLFKYFISALGSTKFQKKESFFFSNALFYCKTLEEFDQLEKSFNKMEKPQGFLPFIHLIVKFLWKRSLFSGVKDSELLEDKNLKDKNNLFLEKISKEIESEITKKIKNYFAIFHQEAINGINEVFGKIINIFRSNHEKNIVEQESLHLASQICEEYFFSIKKMDVENNFENSADYNETNLWYLLKYLKNFFTKEKIEGFFVNRPIQKRIWQQNEEIKLRILMSLDIPRQTL